MTITDPVQGMPERAEALCLGGARVDLLSRAEVVLAVERRLVARTSDVLCIASANVDHIRYFGKGASDASLLNDTEQARWLILLDGRPLQWKSERLVGHPCDLLPGSDLLPGLLEVASRLGSRVGFLGGTAAMQEQLAVVLQGEPYSGLTVAGMWSPSRDELEADSAKLARLVRASSVDLLVVGLGKPRQEHWLAEYATCSGIRVGLAFGAAADFLAGISTRAPAVTRQYGLEWAWRLAHEPKRLGRRYLVRGPVDVAKLLTASGPMVGMPAPSHVVVPAPRAPEAAPASGQDIHAS